MGVEIVTKALSREQILESARSLVPMLRARSLEISQNRSVPADVMKSLYEAGLMELTRPKRYGGPEFNTDLLFRVAHILAQGDGSVAWVYSVTSGHDHLVGLYPQAVQDEYWSSARPLCASSYVPQGKNEKVDGGYRLTGQWSFSSGIDHCDWVVVGSLVFSEGSPAPRLGLFLLRSDEFEINDDWYTMGLCGTGSKSLSVKDMFLSEDRVLFNDDVLCGNTPGSKLTDNPLYSTSIWILFAYSIIVPASGILRGAYEHVLADCRAKVAKGDPSFAARKVQAQMRLSEVGVMLEACEFLFFSSLEETVDIVMSGRPVDLEVRTRNRRNQVYVAATCRQAMDKLMQMVGGTGIREDGPVQRAMRDIYAISAHPGSNLDGAFTSHGSVLLGGDHTEMFC